MKRFALLFSFLSLAVMCTISNAGEISRSDSLYREIQDGAVLPFFMALKNGDINGIKRHISPEMYTKYKRLLEDNKEYPQFLRDYYRGAKFRMERTTRIDNHAVVDVMIEFPDGRRSIKKMRVLKKRGGLQDRSGSNNWEIGNQTVGSAQDSSEKVSSPE